MVKCYVTAVMKRYKEVLSHVKVICEKLKEFALRVGIHLRTVLLPFIFAVVMDVVTKKTMP